MNPEYTIDADGVPVVPEGRGIYCKHCGALHVFNQIESLDKREADKEANVMNDLAPSVIESIKNLIRKEVGATSTGKSEARLAN